MLTTTPAGLDEIIETFGLSTPNFESRSIVPFTLPYLLFYEGVKVTRARCHHLLVENSQQAFERIHHAGLNGQASTCFGIYNARPIVGQPQHASTPSWGTSFNMKRSATARKQFPVSIVGYRLVLVAGFDYGGDFISRKDPKSVQHASLY